MQVRARHLFPANENCGWAPEAVPKKRLPPVNNLTADSAIRKPRERQVHRPLSISTPQLRRSIRAARWACPPSPKIRFIGWENSRWENHLWGMETLL